MVTISKSLVFALTSAIAIGTATFGAHAEGSTTQVFKAGRGISLDVGSQRASAYFTAGDKVCDLTLMFADRADADGHVNSAITRMNIPVAAGTRSRIHTADGQALEASCGLSVNVMTLRPVALTAATLR